MRLDYWNPLVNIALTIFHLLEAFYHSAFIPLQHSAFVGIVNGDEMPVVIDSGASASIMVIMVSLLVLLFVKTAC